MRLIIPLLLATPAWADPPRLALPLDCDIGATCYIEDYVDNAPEPGVQRDFACGINSRDGHKGTDFALLSFDALGTPVLAAAPGTVLRTRDAMPDDRLMLLPVTLFGSRRRTGSTKCTISFWGAARCATRRSRGGMA